MFALHYDRSVRLAWYGLGTFTLIIAYLLSPLSANEALLLATVYALIIITEIQNSALEYALDHLHPDTHDNIGRSKDLAAAAVLVAGVLYTGVVITLLIMR
jgi:diacylglycerol kinase